MCEKNDSERVFDLTSGPLRYRKPCEMRLIIQLIFGASGGNKTLLTSPVTQIMARKRDNREVAIDQRVTRVLG